MVLLLVVLGACASGPSSTAPRTAPTISHHTATDRPSQRPNRPNRPDPTRATEAARDLPLVLLPRACTVDDIAARPGPFVEPMTSRQGLDVRLQDVSDSPCWLGGVARVTLLDRDGHSLPFTFSHPRTVAPGHVVLTPGASAQVLLSRPRCDARASPPAAAMTLRLPVLGGVVRLGGLTDDADAVPLCEGAGGAPDPSYRLQVSAVLPAATPAVPYRSQSVPEHVALRLDDELAPGSQLLAEQHPPTYARADLDGDGRRDVVIVHPGGLVVARLSGSGRQSLHLHDPGPWVRLRALATTVAGQGVDILAAGTPANGSESGYDAPLLRVWHGRLGLVRLTGGRLLRVLVSSGDGDLYAGFRCGSDLTLGSGLIPDEPTVREVHVRIDGLTAQTTRVDRPVLDEADARRATAVDCPGIRPAPQRAGP